MYKSLSQIEHVKLRPNLYVGSVVPTRRDAFLWNGEAMVFMEAVPYCEGLVKIFDEAIDNAIDNSIGTDNPTTTIKVTLSDMEFSVKNDGRGIPVREMNPGDTRMIPEVIFGECLSGSNFGDDRESIGANGLGVKLANIMSSVFSVACYDAGTAQTFRATWVDGMTRVEKKRVTPTTKAPPTTTEVSFKPTLSRFNNNPEVVLSSIADMGPWIQTRLVQLAATHPNRKLRVFYNGTLIKCRDFKAFMKSFPGSHTFYDRVTPDFEYGVSVSSTGQFEHQSFVNCQHTPSAGSTHTKYVTGAVVKVIKEYLASKHRGVAGLTSAAISAKLNIFVNIRLPNPGFTSQTKVELSSPISANSFPIDKSHVLGVLKKSGVIAQLEEALQSKVLGDVSKTLNARGARTVNVEKYDSAHAAGTKASSQCTLFIVEGDSAKTMVTTGMSVIGRKHYGVFPIRGKLLNVRGASPVVLKGNKEVQNIMKILGLHLGKKYDTPEERATLRYGKLCVLTDADVDGHHITGLLINFIAHFWPSLAPHFFVRFVTPIIKVTCKSPPVARHFFNGAEFEAWRATTPNAHRYFVQHLKGLGTSERADTIQYFRDLEKHLKTFTFGQGTMELTTNIFDPKRVPWRKEWLTARGDDEIVPLDYGLPLVPVDDFFNSELYEFSRADIVRSIPSVIDGLKKSQRQALCGALHHFERTGNQKYKVAQLSGVVAAFTKYAHGEVSMQDTIVNMAQDFAGSNNMPLFMTQGAFGSRMQNGKDAASARYIYTSLREHTRKIFPGADDEVLQYPLEEGSRVQPRFYVPTIPLLLLNGAHGIGTGFATKLPCFKLEDVVGITRRLLRGETGVEDPLPHYAGYSTNHKTTEDASKWTFCGGYEVGPAPNRITITELPIGVSIEGYKEKVLDKLVESKLVTKYIVNHVNENCPRFEVTTTGPVIQDNVLQDFKLTTSISKNCMFFLDRDGKVVQFKSIVDIVAAWLETKLEYVEKRRQAQIKRTRDVVGELETKIKFVRGVVEDKIVLAKRTESDIRQQMVRHGIPEASHERLLGMSLLSVSAERVEKLERELTNHRDTETRLVATNNVEIFHDDLARISPERGTKRERDEVVTQEQPVSKK